MKTFLFYRQHPREAVSSVILYRLFIIALLTLLFSFTKANAGADSTLIKISVIDNENSEAIPFANVMVYQNGVQVAVATTDMDGRCNFKNLVPGKYDFKAVYVGYVAQEIKRVDVFAQKTNWLNIKIKGGTGITCCCVCYCFDDRSENWWPKLWTPYREMYKEWKEKKERKLAGQTKKNEIKLSEEPDERGIADSLEAARIVLVEEMKKEIKIYPNPASDVLHIESTLPLQFITLINEEGKIVREESMQSSVKEISLDGFANGIYYLNYIMNGKVETKKIVVIE